MAFTELENNMRSYRISESCIFKLNTGEFGGLSNMSNVFPLEINNIRIKSSEALYQACKFPDKIDLQIRIINEKSPFITKMIAKGKETRSDWMQIRVQVMRWCLRLKLAQNYQSFGSILKSTGNKDIIENSSRDLFWGAKQMNDTEFQGINALGRLLMELRKNYINLPQEEILIVEPPSITNFLLFGNKIDTINMNSKYIKRKGTSD